MYDEYTKNVAEIINVFEEYFGKELVDNSLYKLSELVDTLSNKKFKDCLPSSTDIVTDEHNIIHFTHGDNEITLTSEQAKVFAEKPFLEVVTTDMIPFYEDTIKHILYNNINHVHITVRFPEVRITNEADKYIDIQDLYARVTIRRDGTLVRNIQFTRSTYTAIQYLSDYAHSHLPGISLEWTEPCYGTGPIISTMETLSEKSDLDFWGLLCYELSKYVTVESLQGVPYRRLESVGANTGRAVSSFINYIESMPRFYNSTITEDLLKEFLTSFLNKYNLEFSFYNGRYDIGEPITSLWIKLSRAFSEWYNKQFIQGKIALNLELLKSAGILHSYIIANGTVYSPQSIRDLDRARQSDGIEMFVFKGEMVRLRIIGIEEVMDTPITYLIDHRMLDYLVTIILKVINYKYGREEKNGEVTTKKKCLYI